MYDENVMSRLMVSHWHPSFSAEGTMLHDEQSQFSFEGTTKLHDEQCQSSFEGTTMLHDEQGTFHFPCFQSSREVWRDMGTDQHFSLDEIFSQFSPNIGRRASSCHNFHLSVISN